MRQTLFRVHHYAPGTVTFTSDFTIVRYTYGDPHLTVVTPVMDTRFGIVTPDRPTVVTDPRFDVTPDAKDDPNGYYSARNAAIRLMEELEGAFIVGY